MYLVKFSGFKWSANVCHWICKGYGVLWRDHGIHGNLVIREEYRKVSVLSILLVVYKMILPSYRAISEQNEIIYDL